MAHGIFHCLCFNSKTWPVFNFNVFYSIQKYYCCIATYRRLTIQYKHCCTCYHDTIIGITNKYLKFIDKINQMIARRKEKKANFLTISKPYPQPPSKIVVICFKYKNINLVVFSTFIKLLTQN